MLHLQEFTVGELNFAFCYHLYLRWHTYRRTPLPVTDFEDTSALEARLEELDVHLLDIKTHGKTDIGSLLSLNPFTSTSVAASRIKGQCSRWMRERFDIDRKKLFGRGYFATTCGKNNEKVLMRYLECQKEHHSYVGPGPSPAYAERYKLTAEQNKRLQTNHARTRLHFHFVLSTERRQGFFGRRHAEAMTEKIREIANDNGFGLLKVSFVPDHVHLAMCLHPTTVPAELVTVLLNEMQDLAAEEFQEQVREKALNRLWEPGAYVGSFGDLSSASIKKYMSNWSAE